MGMKAHEIVVDMDAELVNSYGEYEAGATTRVTGVYNALKFMQECLLSGSPDCTFISHYKLYNEEGKVIREGPWHDLRGYIHRHYGITGIK